MSQTKYIGCQVPDCPNEHHAHGFCATHWHRLVRYEDIELPARMYERECEVEGCNRKAVTQNLCNPHAHRLRRYGDPTYKPPVTDYSEVDTALYNIWNAMKQRCYNPNVKSYQYYGARGIWVCEGWRTSYIAFVADMGTRERGMTLERKDNSVGYTCGHCDECIAKDWPKNVVWATRTQQNRNTRQNHYITIDGRTQTIAEWSLERGLGRGTISDRLYAGWSENEAVMTPLEGKRDTRFLHHKQPAATKQNATGYRGVTKKVNRYRALIVLDRTRFNLGHYLTAAEAAWMYDQWALSYYKDDAVLNFDYVSVPRQDKGND